MRKVEVNIKIQCHSDEVIKAFIDPVMLKDWWNVEETLIDKREGGVYTLVWGVSENGFGYVSTGIISKYDPSKELKIDNYTYLNPKKPLFGPMSLEIRANQSGDTCDVYLCQDGYQDGDHWDWYYEVVKEAWPDVILLLKKYLEGPSTEMKS